MEQISTGKERILRCDCGGTFPKHLGNRKFEVLRIQKGQSAKQILEHSGDTSRITCSLCGKSVRFSEVLRSLSSGKVLTVTATEDMALGCFV